MVREVPDFAPVLPRVTHASSCQCSSNHAERGMCSLQGEAPAANDVCDFDWHHENAQQTKNGAISCCYQRTCRRSLLGTLLWMLALKHPCEIVSDAFSSLPTHRDHSTTRRSAVHDDDLRLWDKVGQNPDDIDREVVPGQIIKNHSNSSVVDRMQQPSGPSLSQSRRRVVKWSASLLLSSFFKLPATDRFTAVPPAEATSSTTIASETPVTIPFASLRRYKCITLRNGLPVLLVSDKSVPYCQAAMAVPAGQFYDGTVPGLAHLMEHMVLSTPVTSSTRRSDVDLESWLTERDGASNAFTANQRVCFHFTCPKQVFGESLDRFAAVFRQKAVEAVCRNRNVLRREIRRVDSELNFDSIFAQEEHLTKGFINLEHPFSVFSKGSIETLERKPLRDDINIGDRLVAFFRRQYLPHKSILVVVGAQDLSYLERWAAPFSDTMVVPLAASGSQLQQVPPFKDYFPGQFLFSSRQSKRAILKRNQADELPLDMERLSMQWITNLDYRNEDKLVTVNEVVFVLSQILCRRGPGSLYLYLKRRGWIPDTAIHSLPKISIPVDVSGFQIIKLELLLTIEGFVNRGSVANAVFESIKTVRTVCTSIGLPRNLMTQYASVAKLFGYHLAPRPPDAVELAFDALVYNHDEVCSGLWYRFPTSLGLIQRTVSETVDWMCEPDNALIIVTATGKTLKLLSISDKTRRWLTEPISGASFDFDDAAYQRSSLQSLVSEAVGQQELLPPFFNPLIPNVLGRPEKRKDSVPAGPPLEGEVVQGWQLAKLQSLEGIFLPRQPSDSEYGRCAFVVQLLSSKPARASVRQAARGELWKVLFEASITDLTELGASGGLAYDISFNKFGIRFAFLGVNQTLPSYVRRMFRRLLEHRRQMLQQLGDNPADLAKARSVAISSARSARGLSPGRRARIISNLRTASFLDVGTEGSELINSITGAVAISQGNFEAAMDVVKDVDSIFTADASVGKFGPPMMSLTSMSELCYKPNWKPRFASGCYVPGVNFMSDACGRITR